MVTSKIISNSDLNNTRTNILREDMIAEEDDFGYIDTGYYGVQFPFDTHSIINGMDSIIYSE